MKHLINLILIICMMVIIYWNQGWWQLVAMLPFLLVAINMSPASGQENKSKPGGSATGELEYEYAVADKMGNKVIIKCKCPAQFEGGWAHFTNEIKMNADEFFSYIPHLSLYEPLGVELQSQTAGAELVEDATGADLTLHVHNENENERH